MKTYLRIAVLFSVVIVLLVVFSLFRRASEPESAIIAKERNRIAASLDKSRMENDLPYALQHRERLHFLDYRIAVALNAEKKPDEAISILQKLIADQNAMNTSGILRGSRSYQNEANYYETLEAAYRLKQDEAGAEKASRLRNELLARAEEARKRESREEGRSVGLFAE